MNFLKTALIAFVLLPAGLAHARLMPSFHLESCAMNATDIVVADEGETIDGELTVLEVWTGGLKPGATIHLPGLERFAHQNPRTEHRFWIGRPGDEQEPVIVDGRRMVLFLKRVPEQDKQESAAPPKDVEEADVWTHASRWGDIGASVAWVHEKKTFAYQQVVNPGPSALNALPYSEKAMKERTLAITKARDILTSLLESADPSAAAATTLSYLDSEFYAIRMQALGMLGELGDAALPKLRSILKDPKRLAYFSHTVKAMEQAGGERVLDDMIRIVDEELGYWKKNAPGLDQGWWNGKGELSIDRLGELRSRYSYVLEALRVLEQYAPEDSRPAVQAFRDYWRSMPQLEDKSALDQMSETCDKVLAVLDDKRRQR